MKTKLSTLLHDYLEALDDDLQKMDTKIKNLSTKITGDLESLEKIIQPSSMARLDTVEDDVEKLKVQRDDLREKFEHLFTQLEIEDLSQFPEAIDASMPNLKEQIEKSDEYRTAIIEIEEEAHQGRPTGIFNFLKEFMMWKESPAEHIEREWRENRSTPPDSIDD